MTGNITNGPGEAPSPDESTQTVGALTPAQLKSYNENGYLVIPHTLPPSTITSLLSETHTLLNNFPLSTHPLTKFTTGSSQTPHIGDTYFLTSGDKIRFFFEESAISPATPTSPPHLLKPKSAAINKIGHALHPHPPFHHPTFSPLHRSIARSLGFSDPRVLQSMIICKQPEIGGAVPSHQDSTFLYTDPPSAVGFWIALEDAGKGNGALRFARGSHRRVPVRKRFVRMEGGGTGFEDVGGAGFPEGEGLVEGEGGGVEGEVYTLEEVQAGTLVVIHGNVLHKSERNLSGKSRFAYTFHVIEGGVVYDERNWLRPGEGGSRDCMERRA